MRTTVTRARTSTHFFDAASNQSRARSAIWLLAQGMSRRICSQVVSDSGDELRFRTWLAKSPCLRL